eukprot:2765615-Prymnesium_polylepis.1
MLSPGCVWSDLCTGGVGRGHWAAGVLFFFAFDYPVHVYIIRPFGNILVALFTGCDIKPTTSAAHRAL